MTLTGEQIKVARELLGWTPSKLAVKSTLPTHILNLIEGGQRPATARNLADIRSALENAGIDFDGDGPGVRLRKTK